MSYTQECIINIDLRKLLFFHLAEKENTFISENMPCCLRIVTDLNQDLMRLFFGGGRTSIKKIYSIAKSCPVLCNELADEFRHKYPGLAPIVEFIPAVRFDTKEKDGKKIGYIHRLNFKKE